MLLAMARDIRVILIKLADRLHNMRTLGAMRPEKAPADRARDPGDLRADRQSPGLNSIRHELEDLGFAAYWPWRHRVLSQALRTSARQPQGGRWVRSRRRCASACVRRTCLARCTAARSTSTASTARCGRNTPRSAIWHDIYAFRIVVDRVDTCYRVLGAVHNLYKPMPGRFKDYIAIPKANGYQSLHTVLFGPYGLPIEIQIRTEEMHRVAEAGIAAHWLLQGRRARRHSAADSAAALAAATCSRCRSGSGDSVEFLEHVKVDLFPDEVYVFTPRGKILVLPRGATVIDFAYAVHTDVGNQLRRGQGRPAAGRRCAPA